ncbi:MAG: phosphate-starvation-inducible PsiE family protein [Methanomicrobiales archaeon]|nr:phosphate-starvation-inducible PsiE family protein [Methanomicrobiales archaeon]
MEEKKGPEDRNSLFIRIVSGLTSVTTIIYLIIAVILIVLVGFSFYDVFLQILSLPQAGTLTDGILEVLHTILLSIIILELLDTVVIYFQTHQVQVRPILFAGLTAMIRRVLVFGVEKVEFLDLLTTVAVIAVLTAAIVLIGREKE